VYAPEEALKIGTNQSAEHSLSITRVLQLNVLSTKRIQISKLKFKNGGNACVTYTRRQGGYFRAYQLAFISSDALESIIEEVLVWPVHGPKFKQT
jgi:hypothetical protein